MLLGFPSQQFLSGLFSQLHKANACMSKAGVFIIAYPDVPQTKMFLQADTGTTQSQQVWILDFNLQHVIFKASERPWGIGQVYSLCVLECFWTLMEGITQVPDKPNANSLVLWDIRHCRNKWGQHFAWGLWTDLQNMDQGLTRLNL